MDSRDGTDEGERKKIQDHPEKPESSSRLSDSPEKFRQRELSMGEKMSAREGRRTDSRTERQTSREKRAEIVENMVREGPKGHRDQSRDLHFLDDKEYNDEAKRRAPGASREEIETWAGITDPRDGQAYVRDNGDTLNTAVHEKLHQKSAGTMPERMDEGVTEYLAREKGGAVGALDKTPTDYENEVRVAGQLEAMAGRDVLNKAYFEGDERELRQSVDSQLGEGSYEKIQQQLEDREYPDIMDMYSKKQGR